MRLGRYIDITDKVFGDIIFTSKSKYAGHRAVENAVQYCHKHGYKIVEFDGVYSDGYFVINTAYVIPAEYSTVEEYERAETEKSRKAREEQQAEYTIYCRDGKEVKTSNLSWALKVIKLRGGAVYGVNGLIAQEGAEA